MKARPSFAFRSVTALITLSSCVFADDNFWTGAVDRNWNEAGNWSLNRVPVKTSDTVFDDAFVNILTNFPIITADLAATPRDIKVGMGTDTNGRVDHLSGTAATGAGNWSFVGAQGGTGVYNLANTATTGGTFTTFGTGSGNKNVGGRLYVGGANAGTNGGTGLYNVNTSGTLAIGNDLVVGARGGTGVFNLDAGTVTTGGWNFIGRPEGASGADGTLNISGGLLRNGPEAGGGGRTYVGDGNTVGRLNITGGEYRNPGDRFVVGAGNLAHAETSSVSVSGGTLTTGLLSVGGQDGGNGKGIVTVSGGAINSGEIWVGNSVGSTGTMIVSAGTVRSNGWLAVGRAGATGTLTISGTGAVEKGTGGSMELSNNAAGNATVNLDGGSLSVNNILTGGGTSTFNFNGGVLRAVVDHGTFMQGLTTANVKAGGAIIDTAGFNITIAQNLVADPTSTGGGLTKQGAGTLTLSGTNTYTGTTTVAGGTLAATSAAAFANSTTLEVAEGANLDVTALGSFTLSPGKTVSGGGSVIGNIASSGQSVVFAPDRTLTVQGAFDASPGATFNFELGNLPDLIAITGQITGSGPGGLLFNFSDAGGVSAGTAYDVITFGSASGLEASDFSANLPAGWSLDSSYGTNGWLVDGDSASVRFAAIPEPAAALLGALGTFLLLRRRKD